MTAFGQTEWGSGIFRDREAPAGSVYDAVNLLVDGQGKLFQRGASALYSASDAADPLVGMAAVSLAGGDRVLEWTTNKTYALDGSMNPVAIPNLFESLAGTNDYPTFPLARIPVIQGVAVLPRKTTVSASVILLLYAGSLKPRYNTGSISATAASRTVTGSGTSWTANVDPGGFFRIGTGEVGIVESVESNTSLTLRDEFPVTYSGSSYNIDQALSLATATPFAAKKPWQGIVAAVGQRVVFATGNRLYFSEPSPFTDLTTDAFDALHRHELPAGAQVTGLDTFGDTLIVFTTAGVWSIENMSLDATDDAGNPQQILGRRSDLILWGDSGVVGWEGTLVVPAVDDVHLMAETGESRPISEAIRPLYRDYVNAGYRPGLASVHRGHLHLPVVNGTTLVDTLVCRLDRGTPWTRWAGHAASIAYAQSIGPTTREPKLFGIAGERVTDLTATLDGQGATDADGAPVEATFTTIDYPTSGGMHAGTVTKIRARYELDGPSGDVSFASEPNGALAAPWLAWTSSMPTITGGKAFDTGGLGDATRPESIGPDCSCELVFDAPLTLNNGENFGVGLRLTAHSGAANGYMLEILDQATGFRPRLYKGAGFATVATGSLVTGVIDGIRLTAEGSTITGYFRIGGVWTQVVSATDATYTAAGYPGFWVQDPTAGADLGAVSFAWSATAGVTPEFTSDKDGGVFAELAFRGGESGADGWDESDGSAYQWAKVGKSRERIRFRFSVTGAARFTWRALEGIVRPTGRS